jgi:hypothetical protein
MAKLIAITKVSIDKLKVVPEYKELIPENNSYEELKESIKQLGFLTPIAINQKNEILDGHTRFAIAQELGIKEIPVEIYETRDKEEELDIIASLNLKRRQLTKDEMITIIDKINEKKKVFKMSEVNHNTNTMTLPKDDKTSVKQESREIKEELKRLIPDAQINEETIRKYLQVKKEVPWLTQYIGDEKKGKIGIKKAYEIYLLLKEKNLLDIDKRIPKSELSKIITDRYGRKILERDDLLQQILDHKLAVSQAINQIKVEEKQQRSKKKSKVKEDLEEEEEESKGEEGETSGSEEPNLLEEWKKALEEETKRESTSELSEKEETPPTRIEIHTPKVDLDSLYNIVPLVKKLVDEGKLTTNDVEKIYEIWRNMEAIYKQASLLWYNTIDKILERVGLSEKEREEVFYGMTKPYYRLFSKEEVFPKEILEGKL